MYWLQGKASDTTKTGSIGSGFPCCALADCCRTCSSASSCDCQQLKQTFGTGDFAATSAASFLQPASCSQLLQPASADSAAHFCQSIPGNSFSTLKCSLDLMMHGTQHKCEDPRGSALSEPVAPSWPHFGVQHWAPSIHRCKVQTSQFGVTQYQRKKL